MIEPLGPASDVWLPVAWSSNRLNAQSSGPSSARLELVDAVAEFLGDTLDHDLLILDRASALLELPDGERFAAESLTEGARNKIFALGKTILGTGNLRDGMEFAASERLTPVALDDVTRLAVCAAHYSPDSDILGLVADLSLERELARSALPDELQVAIGRTITGRNGGNFKGGERVGEPSLRQAEAIVQTAWTNYRFVISMLVADGFGPGRDPHRWLSSSPQHDLHAAAVLLRQLDSRDAAVSGLLAQVDAAIAGDSWKPRPLTRGDERPLISEYLYVLGARGES